LRLNIVLVEPEIPQNTGNIARTCAATDSVLHLVGPMGFSISDKHLKRAGLDYWDDVEVHYYNSFLEVQEKFPQAQYYFATTKAPHNYAEVAYEDDCFLVFGKETKGLPEPLLQAHLADCVRIPMIGEMRSLNLSNAVAIVTYEYYRQKGFVTFQQKGKLE